MLYFGQISIQCKICWHLINIVYEHIGYNELNEIAQRVKLVIAIYIYDTLFIWQINNKYM